MTFRSPRPLRRTIPGSALLILWALAARPSGSLADPALLPGDFVDELMADALDEPVGLAEVPDAGAGRPPRMLFVEQRTARVGVIAGGLVFTVGTVPGVASAEIERGLLGIAVDPDWPARPYIYIHCTDQRSGHHVSISRFTMTGDLAFAGSGQIQFDAASRYDLLPTLPDVAQNHNGGTVRFGNDRMLYVSLGDDASNCPAQDSSKLEGKILRLDVSRLPDGAGGPAPIALLAPAGNPYAAAADSGARLVWAIGLRNPFRFTVDPVSGSLLIGDVGEAQWEELDIAFAGGMDFGWPWFEGPLAHITCVRPAPEPFTAPIYAYDHSDGLVVIGGPVYHRPTRGSGRFPQNYEGEIFYLDYYAGFMRRLEFGNGAWAPPAPAPGQPNDTDWGTGFDSVSDLIEVADGSLWYSRQSPGEIRRIRYAGTTTVPGPLAYGFWLATPRPSPSRGHVTLEWQQPRHAAVRLEIYDVSGRMVRLLRDEPALDPGTHSAVWDGADNSGRPARSGRYFARLVVGDAALEDRITLIR